jgi:hypothetical protein
LELGTLFKGERSKDVSELLSCPFCGGEAGKGTVKYSQITMKEQSWGQCEFYFINCTKCGANNQGIVGHKTPEKAETHWNTRKVNHADHT